MAVVAAASSGRRPSALVRRLPGPIGVHSTVTLRPAPTPAASSSLDAFNDASCALGKGDPGAECVRTGASRLLSEYEQAIDLLVQQQPSLFDLKDEAAPGTKAYKVLDKDGYMNGLVRNLRAAHLCAERDPDDGLQETIKLKNTSDYSEDYDVLLASGHVRRGEGAYRLTCEPASFPLDRKGDVPPIGSGCGRPVPAGRDPLQLQGPHQEPHGLHARLDADRGTRRELLRGDRLRRRALALHDTPRGRARTARPARTGGSARPRTPAARVRPGPRATAATARGRRAAARTTPTRTRSSPT